MKKGKIRKVGNSLGLILPQDYVRALDLHDGDEISLRVSGPSLIMDRFDSQLLEQMEAYHKELLKFKHTFRSLE